MKAASTITMQSCRTLTIDIERLEPLLYIQHYKKDGRWYEGELAPGL
jgi:hypothetical protein